MSANVFVLQNSLGEITLQKLSVFRGLNSLQLEWQRYVNSDWLKTYFISINDVFQRYFAALQRLF